ncbi:MAG: SurA N-terminal domain-containing protein [Desulfobacterales bacterium]|nr:SurA N-terminal domain-containing protein [Desulfobacterales bacterium]
MKSRRLMLPMLLAVIMFSGCGPEHKDEKRVVARVNDCDIAADEFRRALARSYKKEIEPLTEAQKNDLLDQMIKEELLVQEAKTRNLDLHEDFRRTIQIYWKQTLIRNLLEQVGEDLTDKIYVSKEDIADFKNEQSTAWASMSPKEMEQEIFERKKTEALKRWLEQLQARAVVKVDRQLVDSIAK